MIAKYGLCVSRWYSIRVGRVLEPIGWSVVHHSLKVRQLHRLTHLGWQCIIRIDYPQHHSILRVIVNYFW